MALTRRDFLRNLLAGAPVALLAPKLLLPSAPERAAVDPEYAEWLRAGGRRVWRGWSRPNGRVQYAVSHEGGLLLPRSFRPLEILEIRASDGRATTAALRRLELRHTDDRLAEPAKTAWTSAFNQLQDYCYLPAPEQRPRFPASERVAIATDRAIAPLDITVLFREV